ncbi:class F sortase [Streptomyces sp. NBC_00151]|uniref:class F sortase n=1 Tax=Streptomyces sp. NBC_00151 TaxID=2975669 RepID=UPI002DDA64F8|nr:class F sortase [Streptomyces sp. NBC_00151]WRZ40212.1 class F sortase [Streptomyces sp. NBC_00151]
MAARLSSPAETPHPSPERTFRRRVTWVVWCAGLAVLVATNVLHRQDQSSGPASPAAAAPVHSHSHSPAPTPTPTPTPVSSASASNDRPAAKHLPRAEPTRLHIPKISVDAPFTDLAIDTTGKLEAPPANDTNLVGWYAKGVSPGEVGTAVIAGHVDTKTSAAVFAGLEDLKKGDKFSVERSDGRTASFVVDSAETFAKDAFPDDRVYADTPDAEVRLITCAGAYDRAVKDYIDNLVVFAHLV